MTAPADALHAYYGPALCARPVETRNHNLPSIPLSPESMDDLSSPSHITATLCNSDAYSSPHDSTYRVPQSLPTPTSRQTPQTLAQTKPPMRLFGTGRRVAHVQGRVSPPAKLPLASADDAPRYQPWRPRVHLVTALDVFEAQCEGDDDMDEDNDNHDGYAYTGRPTPLWTSPASMDTDLDADDESSGSASSSASSRTGSAMSSTSSSIVSLSPEFSRVGALRDDADEEAFSSAASSISLSISSPPRERGERGGNGNGAEDGGRKEEEEEDGMHLIYHNRGDAFRERPHARPRVRFLEQHDAYNDLDDDDDELSPLSPLSALPIVHGGSYGYAEHDYSEEHSAYTHPHTSEAKPALPLHQRRIYPREQDDGESLSPLAPLSALQLEEATAFSSFLRAAPLPSRGNICSSPSSSESASDRTPRATPPPREVRGTAVEPWSVTLPSCPIFPISSPASEEAGSSSGSDTTPRGVESADSEPWPGSVFPPLASRNPDIATATASTAPVGFDSPRLPRLELPFDDDDDDDGLESMGTREDGTRTLFGDTWDMLISDEPTLPTRTMVKQVLPPNSWVVPQLHERLALPAPAATCLKKGLAPPEAWDAASQTDTCVPWSTDVVLRDREWTLFSPEESDIPPVTPSRRRSMDLPALAEDVFGLCTGVNATSLDEGRQYIDRGIYTSERDTAEPVHANEHGETMHSPHYRSLPGADTDDEFLPRDLAPKNYVPDPTAVVRSAPSTGLGLWDVKGHSGLGLALRASGSGNLRRRDQDGSFVVDPRVLAALPPDAEAKRVYALRQRHRAGSLGGGVSSTPEVFLAGDVAGLCAGATGGGVGEVWDRERERERDKARELEDLLRLKLGLDEHGIPVEPTTQTPPSPPLLRAQPQYQRTAHHGKPTIASMDQLVASMVFARQADAARKKPARARTWSPPALATNDSPRNQPSLLSPSSSLISFSALSASGTGAGMLNGDGPLAPLPPQTTKTAKTPRSPLRQMLLPDDIEEGGSCAQEDAEQEGDGWRSLATLVESPGALSPLCLQSGMELA